MGMIRSTIYSYSFASPSSSPSLMDVIAASSLPSASTGTKKSNAPLLGASQHQSPSGKTFPRGIGALLTWIASVPSGNLAWVLVMFSVAGTGTYSTFWLGGMKRTGELFWFDLSLLNSASSLQSGHRGKTTVQSFSPLLLPALNILLRREDFTWRCLFLTARRM